MEILVSKSKLKKHIVALFHQYRGILFLILCLLLLGKEGNLSGVEDTNNLSDASITSEKEGGNTSTAGRGSKEEYFWTTGQVIRIRFENGDWPLQETVRDWITEVTKHANLRFLWHMNYGPDHSKYPADVTIDFGQGSEELKHLIVSAVGTEAYFYPEGNPTMRLNGVATAFNEVEEARKQIRFLEFGSTSSSNNKYSSYTDKEYLNNTIIPHYLNTAKAQVKHEALHMLGFVHEQHHPYANIPWKADVNLKLEAKDLMIIKYDPTSLAHYPTQQYEHLVVQGAQLNQVGYNVELSEGDIERIKMLYPPEEIDPPAPPQAWVDAGLFSMPEVID